VGRDRSGRGRHVPLGLIIRQVIVPGGTWARQPWPSRPAETDHRAGDRSEWDVTAAAVTVMSRW